jgi:hypothetical protein
MCAHFAFETLVKADLATGALGIDNGWCLHRFTSPIGVPVSKE